MSHNRNVTIKSGNRLDLSGSTVTVTGSLSASALHINNSYSLPTANGSSGQVISSNGTGQLVFSDVSAGSSPGGVDTSVQFNSGSTLSGSTSLTYDYNTGVLSGTISQFTTVTASNLVAGGVKYPTTDGTNGQILVTDGAGELNFQDIDVTIRVKNLEATQIDKGTPLYVTASGTGGNIAGVYRADAGNDARMPAACVAGEDISAGAEGVAYLSGFIRGVDTSTFDSGDGVYVAVGGGYTNERPTGSARVQPLGYVEKSDSNGSGVIQGPGHFWDLPNVTAGHFWVGASNGVPTTVASSSFAKVAEENNFTANNIFTTITASYIDVDKITAREYHTELVSASIIYQSGSTKFGDTSDDVHSFTGSISMVSGNLDVNGNAIVSGSLTVTGTVTELSTRKIKKNIRSMKSQLETVSKLNPVTYFRRDTEEKTKEYGFISEEVKEVYPEFVKNEGVNYSKMVSVLVSAVKELKDIVEEQREEIKVLKKKIK